MSSTAPAPQVSERARAIAARVEAFVRDVIVPYERDARLGPHGPSEDLVHEMRDKARKAGVLTPHILAGGDHLTQVETAYVLIRSGLSPLGPTAVNTAAPDEGNMYLLCKV
jgi:acyl-CoA dehydrogenase